MSHADTPTVLRVINSTLIGVVVTYAIGYLMIEQIIPPAVRAHVLDGLPHHTDRGRRECACGSSSGIGRRIECA